MAKFSSWCGLTKLQKITTLIILVQLPHLGCGFTCAAEKSLCSSECLDNDPGSSRTRSQCRCDPLCPYYEDCCVDYWTNCSKNGTRLRSYNLTSRYDGYIGCIAPFTNDPHPRIDRYFVVDKCPTDWPNSMVKDKCEKITLYNQERLLSVFVTGPDDVTFKNVYCALCHGFEKDQLISWSVILWHCKLVQNTNNTNEWDYNSCKHIHAAPPASLRIDPHHCFSGFITENCTENNSTTNHTQLCPQYTARIFNRVTGLTYKNVDCLKCNGSYNEVELGCVVSLGIDFYWFAPSRMFTLLFDFSEGTVYSVQTSGFFEKKTTRQLLLRNCSKWQIHDPFLDVCNDLYDALPRGDEQPHLQCDQGINGAMALCTNRTEYCMKNLTSLVMPGKPTYFEGTSDQFGQQGYTLVIYTEFLSAYRIQDAVDQLLSNITDIDQFKTVTCNASSVILFVSVREMVQSTCEGYAIESFDPNIDLLQSAGDFFVNQSGFIYNQNEFMYEITYHFALNENITVKDPPILRLCSPFVGNRRCSLLTFNREEFQWSSSSSGDILHYASGQILELRDIWQLPDGTLRVCNFFEDVMRTEHPTWVVVISKVSFVNGVLSLVALTFALTSYAVFPSLRTTAGKTIMNVMVAFVLAQVVLMIGKLQVYWLCILRALMLHWSWLTVFFWMSILAGDLAYSLRNNLVPRGRSNGSNGCKLLKFSIYGWGAPVLIVASCFFVSHLGKDRPDWLRYGGSDCWIVDPFHSLLVFGIPVALHLAFNCVMFGFILYTIIVNQNRLAKAQMARSLKSNVLLNLKLVAITGVTWTMFILANLIGGALLWYFSIVVNSLQGLFISLVFLLKENVRNLWRQKLRQIHYKCCECPDLDSKQDILRMEKVPGGVEMQSRIQITLSDA